MFNSVQCSRVYVHSHWIIIQKCITLTNPYFSF
uniref:Uncharacterized protein n=1 Tax=Anguilla anguilla TaxID=7936 RepID=A0A0E9QQN1_ANGAN